MHFIHPSRSESSLLKTTKRNMCFLFAALVLVVTTVWVWVLKDRTFKFLAYAMFFPGVIAVLLSVYDGSVVQFLLTASGLHKVRI